MRLKWTKEKGNLTVQRATEIDLGYLEIKHVETSDSGVYVCTASDGYSAISQKKTLAVGGMKNNN